MRVFNFENPLFVCFGTLLTPYFINMEAVLVQQFIF